MKTTQTIFTSILFGILLSLPTLLSAQDTLTNQGFERWEKSGKPAPFDWSEPVGWTSSNPYTEFTSAGVTQTQLPQSGSQQAMLRTANFFGNPAPAVLIYGNFTINAIDTSKFPLIGGEPATSTKPKLYGTYNFTSTAADDSAMVIVVYKKFNTLTQQTEAVAKGELVLPPTTTGLHSFTVDIKQLVATTPDSVVVTILSSKLGQSKMGGSLIVDYVAFDKPLGLTLPSMDKKAIAYPSPAANLITIAAAKEFSYKVYAINGKEVLKGYTPDENTTIDISTLSKGVYSIQIASNTGIEVLRFIKL